MENKHSITSADTKIVEFMSKNKIISILILSYLQEFFDENILFHKLILTVKYNEYTKLGNLDTKKTATLWGGGSLSKDKLFGNARKNILLFFKRYLQINCGDTFPCMDFSNNKIDINMNLVITDTIPVTINVNTTCVSHQSLSYYTYVEISYKPNNSYKNGEGFASGHKKISQLFTTRGLFNIQDIVSQNIKCKNIILFVTSNQEVIDTKLIDINMISSSKHFIEYFIKTHFLHNVGCIKIIILIQKKDNDNDNFVTIEKIEPIVVFSINSTQLFYATKFDLFSHDKKLN
jgi:hypothetical protein